MAAYGALLSLSHTLHQILDPPPLNFILIDRQRIEFLLGKVNLMIDLLETSHPSRRSRGIAEVEAKIAEAAYEAEDIIESNVVAQIRGENTSTFLCGGIQKVLDKFISIEKQLMKIPSRNIVEDAQPKRLTTASSSKRHRPSGKISMVGFEEHLNEIMAALATDEAYRQIIPIIGMGGIGKTTLASAVYNHPFIIGHFHICAWVTVSQEYTFRVLLLRLLSEITKVDQNKHEGTDDEIGLLLHKKLFGRKYLIVMDDMWDIEAWNRVKWFLPDNGNGSRILVTTRLSNLANDFRSYIPYQIALLDKDKSWDLLRGKVFGKEGCPIELEEIGMNIAKKCGGLPLALVVIGGILKKSERTKENWRSVEEDVTSAIYYGDDDEKLREILWLSYSHLPIYLKPCFLYLAVFPEDFDIRISWVVRLWVAEGLIKRNDKVKCLEEVAQEYFENLISRHLIFVSKRSRNGKMKCCKIHDLLRDLSIAQADKENFLHIMKLDNRNISRCKETKRRLSVLSPSRTLVVTALEALGSAKSNRSWLSHDHWWRAVAGEPSQEQIVKHQIEGFRLLRVAHVDDYTEANWSRDEVDIDILKLINLRYVFSKAASSIPSMSLCWNLQTLIVVNGILALPVEIWRMPQLRHIKMNGITLPNPPPDYRNVIVLENLQTLKTIRYFKCTEQVWERIPNLKKLRIAYFLSSAACEPVGNYFLKNINCFRKLESLKIYGAVCTGMMLPISLKKLSLEYCKIPWEDLTVVGSLPNLEVLNLYSDATQGEEWNPIEEQFCRLKSLMIRGVYLKMWGAENYHFPNLEHLVLHGVMLKEIPMSFAEISTLEEIELGQVDKSVWSSAREISEARELLAYEPLQIRDYFRRK